MSLGLGQSLNQYCWVPVEQPTRLNSRQKGVAEYISIPLGSNLGRYSAVGVSNILRKIFLWSKDNTEELEEMLRSNGISTVEIVKDGPGTLELKR